MNKIEDVIKNISLNPMLIQMTFRYKNSTDLSGFILRKPKFITHDKTGMESCSFIIYQINNKKDVLQIDSFSCITFVKDLVEQLKTLENVTFVATVGKMRFSKIVHGLYSQVVEMETLFELDEPLAEEWERKENDK